MFVDLLVEVTCPAACRHSVAEEAGVELGGFEGRGKCRLYNIISLHPRGIIPAPLHWLMLFDLQDSVYAVGSRKRQVLPRGAGI